MFSVKVDNLKEKCLSHIPTKHYLCLNFISTNFRGMPECLIYSFGILLSETGKSFHGLNNFLVK